MKAIILYESIHHGNTEKIAQVMAHVLEAQLSKPNEVDTDLMVEYDLIGFGSGIYFCKHHKSLLELIDALPIFNKKTFIFSTRGGTLVWLNHKKLRTKLMEKGCHVVGEFSCKGYDTFSLLKYLGGLQKGRPNAKDLDRAQHFAMKLLHSLIF